MKKLLFVLAIGAFAACNDNAGTTESTVDTNTTAPVIAPDTMVTPSTDTLVTPADTSAAQ